MRAWTAASLSRARAHTLRGASLNFRDSRSEKISRCAQRATNLLGGMQISSSRSGPARDAPMAQNKIRWYIVMLAKARYVELERGR